jgi:hypothetical protein
MNCVKVRALFSCLTVFVLFNLMFVPCIIRHSRNNQHYDQICTTALFYMLAPTSFSSSLSSSGSFWIRLSYMKIQIDLEVMLVKCQSYSEKKVTSPTLYDLPPSDSVFSCNSDRSRSSLIMTDYCRNL